MSSNHSNSSGTGWSFIDLWYLSPRYTVDVLWPRQSTGAYRGWERNWWRTKPRSALWIIEGATRDGGVRPILKPTQLADTCFCRLWSADCYPYHLRLSSDCEPQGLLITIKRDRKKEYFRLRFSKSTSRCTRGEIDGPHFIIMCLFFHFIYNTILFLCNINQCPYCLIVLRFTIVALYFEGKVVLRLLFFSHCACACVCSQEGGIHRFRRSYDVAQKKKTWCYCWCEKRRKKSAQYF